MNRETNAAIQTKVFQFAFAVVFLGVVLYAFRGMMFGSKGMVGLVAAFAFTVAAVLVLQDDYWVLMPIVTASNLSLPNLPFTSGELGCLILVSVFSVRVATGKEAAGVRSTAPVLAAVPYLLWVAFIFLLNPVGLNMFGSSMIGGRHYFRIFLGFMSLYVFSKIQLSESGLRILFYGLIACAFLNVGMGVLGLTSSELSDGEVHTRYYLVAFAVVVSLVLCRFDLPRILLSPGLFSVCLLCFGLVVLSGKRTEIGMLVLMPVLLMFLRRRHYVLTVMCGLFGAAAVLLFAAGHGRLYELPYSMQRGLSFLPGRWERSLERYGFRDDFRAELQRRAKLIIRQNPLLGRKGFAMDPREISWLVLYTGARDAMFGGHELSGNWHNKFYGMWADFGAVAPFAWYGFLLFAIRWTFRRRNRYPDGSFAATFYRYWFSRLFFDLILLYGHSSITPFTLWPTFGLLLALNNMTETELRRPVPVAGPVPATRLPPTPGT